MRYAPAASLSPGAPLDVVRIAEAFCEFVRTPPVSAGTAEICQFHGYRLDVVRRQLLDPDGAPVPLMPKAIETLVYLVARAGQTVSKEELLRAVWPNVVVEENNLTQNISALRRAFGETLAERRFIVTIPGQGYRFVAPVTRVADLDAAPVLAAESAPAASPKRRRLIGAVARRRASAYALSRGPSRDLRRFAHHRAARHVHRPHRPQVA